MREWLKSNTLVSISDLYPTKTREVYYLPPELAMTAFQFTFFFTTEHNLEKSIYITSLAFQCRSRRKRNNPVLIRWLLSGLSPTKSHK